MSKALICTASALLIACGNDPTVGTRESEIKCLRQDGKLVTSDYLGALEEVIDPSPLTILHAAAAEVASPLQNSERFVAAWMAKTNRLPYARVYNAGTKAFTTGALQLDSYPGPGWIRPLGYDDHCSPEIPTSTTCAWFTWQDDAGYVNWRAVGTDGTLSGLAYWPGRDSSGDTGVLYGEPVQRKKLLAWITPNRKQVKAHLLYDDGLPIEGTLVTLRDVPVGDWNAYQTAVAWSPQESRWLVAWTENAAPNTTLNGAVYTRYVNFDGTMGPPASWVMYCEGFWYQPVCGGGLAPAATSLGSVVPLGGNTYCACKGIWLTSSQYSTTTDDRYRLQQYAKHAILNSSGDRHDINTNNSFGNTYSALTEASFWYGGDFTPFQSAYENPIINRRLVQNAFVKYDEAGTLMAGYPTPQAIRAAPYRTVVLGTDGIKNAATGLKLTIVDTQPGGCP